MDGAGREAGPVRRSAEPVAGLEPAGAKVQAWGETGAASGWSAPAAFETGFSDQTGGWHASWITLGRIREDFRPPSEFTGPALTAEFS